MNEITCHYYGKSFKVDEAGYADISRQACDDSLEQKLIKRVKLDETAQSMTIKKLTRGRSAMTARFAVLKQDLQRYGEIQ